MVDLRGVVNTSYRHWWAGSRDRKQRGLIACQSRVCQDIYGARKGPDRILNAHESLTRHRQPRPIGELLLILTFLRGGQEASLALSPPRRMITTTDASSHSPSDRKDAWRGWLAWVALLVAVAVALAMVPAASLGVSPVGAAPLPPTHHADWSPTLS